jgi:hypothetical protein
MSYSDFTLKDLQNKFGIKNKVCRLFDKLEPIEPSDWLKTTLEKTSKLPTRSEKAKSESIVFPVLLELRDRNNQFITFYSGDNLNADEENGLKGECDFIITKDTGTFDINYPIIQLVEAKKNDIELGVPQCAAQMVGAKIFNQQNNVLVDGIYGCVTTGNEWLFMQLTDQLYIDNQKYYLNELKNLLAVFQNIIDKFKISV